MDDGSLTEEEIDSYSYAFSLFDVDGDGTIHKCSIISVMRSIGLNPTHEVVSPFLKEFITDNGDCIELPDFLAFMNKYMIIRGRNELSERRWKAFMDEYEEDLKWEQEQYGLADELEDLMKRDLSYRNQTSKPKLMSSSLLP